MNCKVVTCITCTSSPNENGVIECAGCGMLDWLSAFETEEECNAAYKKEHPNEFNNGTVKIK